MTWQWDTPPHQLASSDAMSRHRNRTIAPVGIAAPQPAGKLVRGQVTVEAALLMTVVVAGLVFLLFYLQRAIQGNVFGASQSIGLQYDPRDPHGEHQSIGMTETTTQDVGWSMTSANLLPLTPVDDFPALAHPDWILSSLPTGPVPREPAFYRSQQVTTNWSANRNAAYDDIR